MKYTDFENLKYLKRMGVEILSDGTVLSARPVEKRHLKEIDKALQKLGYISKETLKSEAEKQGIKLLE